MSIWYPFRSFFQRGPARPHWPTPTLTEPESDEETKVLSPMAMPVHVLSEQALVRTRDGLLVVERPAAESFTRPIELVSAVHIYGRPGITSPCVATLLRQGTPVIWRSVSGYPVGISAPLNPAAVEVRRAQYENADGLRGRDVANRLVAAKIASQRGIVRRRAGEARDVLDALSTLARRARQAASGMTLMGLEGAASAAYFSVWPEFLADRLDEMGLEGGFAGRSRRPPRDEVNAALSYAYGVVAGECLAAVAAAGLDPRVGVLHAQRPGRPALALDLLEPFRPVIADQVVLTAVANGQLAADCFGADEAGTAAATKTAAVSLNDVGRQRILGLIEARLAATLTSGASSTKSSYRDAIGLQARAIAGALTGSGAFVALERP